MTGEARKPIFDRLFGEVFTDWYVNLMTKIVCAELAKLRRIRAIARRAAKPLGRII